MTGKILVVDNDYDAVIEKAITLLIKEGLPVQYWNGKGDFPQSIRNVRVVILDLDITGSQNRSSGLTFFKIPAKILKQIPGPYLVIIMAHDFTKTDPASLAKAYIDTYAKPICGIVAPTGIVKSDELHDPKLLKDLILKSIDEDILKMVFLWEDIVERATDLALNDFVPEEINSSFIPIIKTLCDEMGDEAASRELVSLLMQLVSRRITSGSTFEGLINHVSYLKTKVDPPQNPASAQEPRPSSPLVSADLYNKIIYYTPSDEEKTWTGDIYKTANQEKFFDYGIVLNSPCDLAQKKTWSYRICLGFKIDEAAFTDKEYPPYKVDAAIATKLNAAKGNIQAVMEYTKSRYLQKKKLGESLCYLLNVREKDGTFINLCFDFNNVNSFEDQQLEKWERICRLDSPFLEELLQKYVSHAFRIGVLPINRPE